MRASVTRVAPVALVAWRLRLALLLALPLFPRLGLAQEESEEPEEGYEYYEYVDEERVRGALDETLSQPEFARLRALPDEEKDEASESPEWLERFFQWLEGLFEGNEQESERKGFSLNLQGMELLVWLMVALILAAVIVLVAKSVLSAARDKKVAAEEEEATRTFRPASAPGELAPEDYFRRAVAHGENGRFKDGVRELLLGAMSATERRGLIRFRRGLTNRDYLYSVRGAARESFARIAGEFERIYFGRRETNAEAFQECLRAFQSSFREASV